MLATSESAATTQAASSDFLAQLLVERSEFTHRADLFLPDCDGDDFMRLVRVLYGEDDREEGGDRLADCQSRNGCFSSGAILKVFPLYRVASHLVDYSLLTEIWLSPPWLPR